MDHLFAFKQKMFRISSKITTKQMNHHQQQFFHHHLTFFALYRPASNRLIEISNSWARRRMMTTKTMLMIWLFNPESKNSSISTIRSPSPQSLLPSPKKKTTSSRRQSPAREETKTQKSRFPLVAVSSVFSDLRFPKTRIGFSKTVSTSTSPTSRPA